MPYRVLDMAAYPRREHFAYFNSMADPYVGVTVQVDITQFLPAVKASGKPFFLSFLYCIGRAANSVAELRQRIADGGIIEFDSCEASYTVMRPDGTYGYCSVPFNGSFDEYLAFAVPNHEYARSHADISTGENELSCLFVSCLPWLHYTSLEQPRPVPADSNPRISFGKYEEENGKIRIPVTLLVNHALADGLHIGRFYSALDNELSSLARSLSQDA